MVRKELKVETQEKWIRFLSKMTKTIHYLAFVLALCDFVTSLG